MKKLLTLFFLSTALLSSCTTQPSSTYKDGEFFSLKELYESKVLTSDDLLNISYYNNNHKVYDKNDNLIDESTYTIKELDSLSREDEDNIINNYKDVLLDKYQDNSEIKNNIEQSSGNIDSHTVTDTAADAKIIVHGEIHHDQRRKHGIYPDILFGKRRNFSVCSHESEYASGSEKTRQSHNTRDHHYQRRAD